MQNITSVSELKKQIQLLEIEQIEKGIQLIEQVQLTVQNLNPVNLLLNSFKNTVSSPIIIDNILGATVGLISGIISKKLFVGKSNNALRKFIGLILQYGITNVISKHPRVLKSIGQYLFQMFFPKNEKKQTDIVTTEP